MKTAQRHYTAYDDDTKQFNHIDSDGDSAVFKDCNEERDDIQNKSSAVQKHRLFVDDDKAKQELELAQAEWDCVESVETVAPGSQKSCSKPAFTITPLISCSEVVTYFTNCNMTAYLETIVPVVERSRASSMLRYVFGPPRLHCLLEPERDLIFAVASCPLKNDEPVHLQVLQTIYKKLTNSGLDCPRYGPHWEQIGFQGNDPGTDLRGVGFLALLHLLHMVTNNNTLQLAKAILKLSHHPTQNFPFAVMGINMTRIVLLTLREEKLNKECNRRHNVMEVTNEFYIGVFLNVYETWHRDGIKIEDCGWVLKDTENLAKRKPKVIFRQLEDYLKKSHARSEEAHVSAFLLPLPVATSDSADTTPRISHMEPFPAMKESRSFTALVPAVNGCEPSSKSKTSAGQLRNRKDEDDDCCCVEEELFI